MTQSCGLIEDWKTRYLEVASLFGITGCGLIEDWKTRY